MKPLYRVLTVFALALVAGACAPEQPTESTTTEGMSDCSAGESYVAPGCGPPPEGVVEVPAGCYSSCTSEGEECSEGGTCTRAFFDPCYMQPCDACGADTLLCVE